MQPLLHQLEIGSPDLGVDLHLEELGVVGL